MKVDIQETRSVELSDKIMKDVFRRQLAATSGRLEFEYTRINSGVLEMYMSSENSWTPIDKTKYTEVEIAAAYLLILIKIGQK